MLINFKPANIISFKAQKVMDTPPILDREKTVAILGSSKEPDQAPQNAQFIKMAREVAKKLVALGYNVVTGGNNGIAKASNIGASSIDPSKSFAIDLEGWEENYKPPIFNLLAKVKTGAERTDMFRNIAKHWVVFPGGPGSMQELSVGGETKYYKMNNPPEMTLVGREFQKPLFEYLTNMNDLGVASNAEKSYMQADTADEIVANIVGKTLDVAV